MPAPIQAQRVTSGQLGLAVVLLIGVLAIVYGCYHPSKMAVYAGLLLTVGGVITGIIRTVARGGGGEADG